MGASPESSGPRRNSAHTRAAGLLQDEIRVTLQGFHGVRHRHPELAAAQERVVVLAVADGDGAVVGDPQLSQRLMNTESL